MVVSPFFGIECKSELNNYCGNQIELPDLYSQSIYMRIGGLVCWSIL